MKKPDTISVEKFRENNHFILNTEYRFGNNTERMPKTTAQKYNKALEENGGFELPTDRFFMTNDVVYALFKNRDTDEPVTARELYIIIETLRGKISDEISVATYDYNG